MGQSTWATSSLMKTKILKDKYELKKDFSL